MKMFPPLPHSLHIRGVVLTLKENIYSFFVSVMVNKIIKSDIYCVI
jgi:hypothetical protein